MPAPRSVNSKASRAAFNRILLPVEFSELSEAAEATASELARRLGASIHLLHVIEPLEGLAGDPEAERFYAKLEKRATASLTALSNKLERNGIEVVWEIGIGHRWSFIVRRAEELPSDLIVMGTRGLGDAATLAALSSTSHRVAFHAPCPVMLVRPPSKANP